MTNHVLTTNAAAAAGTAFLTEAETSQHLRVPQRTLQRWRTTGQGPRWCRAGPRRVLYRAADIETWAETRTYPHRAAELAATGKA